MSAMNRLATLRPASLRPGTTTGSAVPAQRPLRTREPRGVVDPTEATRRVQSLVGSVVSAVDTSLDRLVVAVAADPVHLVVIAGTVSVQVGAGGAGIHPVPSSAEVVRAAATLVGRPVTALTVDPAGGLTLACGETVLAVAADPHHESWEIRGMDGGLLVCLPGGAISLWTPTAGRVPGQGPAAARPQPGR